LLLTAISIAVIGRAARVQRLVSERTAQLLEANRALAESEALYESLIESLPLNVFRKDLQGRLVSANYRYCQSAGRPLAELIGLTDLDFYPQEVARKYMADDAHVAATGKVLELVEEHV